MITVFTTVYNNYGKFIPKWVEYLNKQTYKPDILIVLGTDHGADIKWLQENKIKYIIIDSTHMSVLRNAALDIITTKWWLYFSVDDELLPKACEYIVHSQADAVSITFDTINIDGSIEKNCYSPMINNIGELQNIDTFRYGGYVAVKNNLIRFDENIEVPNIMLHIDLFRNGLKTIRSTVPLAICRRRATSHGYTVLNPGKSRNMREYMHKEIESIISNRTSITVFTIAYNNYGVFLYDWIKNIKKQTIKPDLVILVLGKNHGAKINMLKAELGDLKYLIIKSQSDTMGVLRNLAVEQLDTEWFLYFSADDVLLPNAIQEINKYMLCSDAIVLRYREIALNKEIKIRGQKGLSINNIFDWRETRIPGYIAVRKKFLTHTLYFENTEIPNYPFLFKILLLGMRIKTTKLLCAEYIKRVNSHGYNAAVNKTKDMFITIVSNTLKDYLKTINVFQKRLICIKPYRDSYLKYAIIKKDVDITKLYHDAGIGMPCIRANYLIKKGLAAKHS